MQTLIAYVNFAATCSQNAAPIPQDQAVTQGHACFTIAGQVRPWTEQSDGLALQTLALLRAYAQLDAATQKTARDLIAQNLAYVLSVYLEPTTAVPGSQPPQSVTDGYDANIDIVSACVYGAIPCTDPKLLATVAVLCQQWSDPGSASLYPINLADQARGIGPLFG